MTPYTMIVTSWEYKDNWKESPYGRLTDRDPNEMCPYCYNENTDRCLDYNLIEKYKGVTFFKDKIFKVFSCHCCNAIFSWNKLK